jgi:hypothetical protein
MVCVYIKSLGTGRMWTMAACQREIMASQSSVQLPVIAFLGYGITNGYWIGSTRYVFEDMCHALLYLYIYTERY